MRCGRPGHETAAADFLIGTDCRVLAVKYGQHASDHWPVGDLLALARREGQAGIITA